ncbi:MAG: hypothetical protein ABIR81_10660 [Ginsengibacter sp.]
MKTLILLLLLPLQMFCQDIAGLWKGFLYNDTTREYLPYELAISNNKQKLVGYSHVTIVVDSFKNLAVKTMKIRQEPDHIFAEDESMIYNNFSLPPPKGVKVSISMTYHETDTSKNLSGVWGTNKTKDYQALTGTINLTKQKYLDSSKVIAKVKDLNLEKTLSFLPENKPQVSVTKAVEKANEILKTSDPDMYNDVALNEEKKLKNKTVQSQTERRLVDSNNNMVSTKSKRNAVQKKSSFKTDQQRKDTANELAKTSQQFLLRPAAEQLAKRQIENIRNLSFKSDSLVISLYDNGDVDGDTVSVVLNGTVIIARQGLSTTAITKTIYPSQDLGDSLQLIMYAENLGAIPPNTGLLILQDGDDRYEIRFAGDLQKNSAVILKRRPKN